jgi:transposase
MPKSYPNSVRRQISHRLRAGDAVADIATETGISPATLFRWKDQVLIDVGVRDGVPSIESDELASARNRIAALEAELVLTRDACALFDDQSVAAPKGRSRSPKD